MCARWERVGLPRASAGDLAADNGAENAGASDVLSGALGETWLFAAIGALAEFPRFFAELLASLGVQVYWPKNDNVCRLNASELTSTIAPYE